MRLKELIKAGIIELEKSGIVEARIDANLLMESCLGKNRTELFLLEESSVDVSQHNLYMKMIERRKKREPVAYILGEWEFWSLPFHVSPDVLVPRPETEFLIEKVLALTSPTNFLSGEILDLCCGSGVIAIVLAIETGMKIVAGDISARALDIAKANRCRHELQEQIDFIQTDLFGAFLGQQKFSLIVSNPPYVAKIDVEKNLEPEVCAFEPHLALDGGDQGLELITQIRNTLPIQLAPGGQVFMEIGADQGSVVKKLFADQLRGMPKFHFVEILCDYAGRDRVLHAILED